MKQEAAWSFVAAVFFAGTTIGALIHKAIPQLCPRCGMEKNWIRRMLKQYGLKDRE
jgi:hypothetical protein